MSLLLEQAVAEARRLPQENQDAVAAIILEEIEENRRWEVAFDDIAEKLAARTARIQALKKPAANDRITRNPDVMGGKPCIRGLRVTVGMILGLLAAGKSHERILRAYPYLELEDIHATLAYAAGFLDEGETLPVVV
jgi:uncharacterized protein (DUF433 family)